MFKKHTYVDDFGLVSNGWVTADPVDLSIIESVYKKDIREGEELLMLAILQDAVACFQEHVLACIFRRKSARIPLANRHSLRLKSALVPTQIGTPDLG